MTIPRISIIMPVFNAEKYLKRAIDSVLAQTFTNWELLLIDDGSTDSSPQICNEYAYNDSRIKTFHKKNEGVAMTRQVGIENAIGEYSIHLDSDDWIEPNMLKDMYKEASKANSDIVMTDFYTYSQSYNTYCPQHPTKLNSRTILYDMLNGKIFGSLWNKLLKHCLYKKFNLKFYKNLDFCEDLLIWCQLLQNDNLNISYLNKAYYHYYKNPNSITNHFTRKSYEMRLSFFYKLEKILDPNHDKEILNKISFNIFTEGFIHNTLSDAEIKDGLHKYKSQIIKLNSLKFKIGYLLLYFGFNNIAHNLIHY